MTGLLQDVKFGFSNAGQNPGFTAAAVISLALTGGNTAIFTVTTPPLLRPFATKDPSQLVCFTQRRGSQTRVQAHAQPLK
jgi:hypothetical protein